MANLSECISLLSLSAEDQAEIGAFIAKAGDDAQGVQDYMGTLAGELGVLRGKIVEGLEEAGLEPELDIKVNKPRSDDDDLLLQVPVERVFDSEGNEVARTMSRQELAAELDGDDEFVEQLGLCMK